MLVVMSVKLTAHIFLSNQVIFFKLCCAIPFTVKINEKIKTFSGAFRLREELFIIVVKRKNDEFLIIPLEKNVYDFFISIEEKK